MCEPCPPLRRHSSNDSSSNPHRHDESTPTIFLALANTLDELERLLNTPSTSTSSNCLRRSLNRSVDECQRNCLVLWEEAFGWGWERHYPSITTSSTRVQAMRLAQKCLKLRVDVSGETARFVTSSLLFDWSAEIEQQQERVFQLQTDFQLNHDYTHLVLQLPVFSHSPNPYSRAAAHLKIELANSRDALFDETFRMERESKRYAKMEERRAAAQLSSLHGLPSTTSSFSPSKSSSDPSASCPLPPPSRPTFVRRGTDCSISTLDSLEDESLPSTPTNASIPLPLPLPLVSLGLAPEKKSKGAERWQSRSGSVFF